MVIRRKRKQPIIVSFAGNKFHLGRLVGTEDTGEFRGGEPVINIEIKSADSSMFSSKFDKIRDVDSGTGNYHSLVHNVIYSKKMQNDGVKLIIADKDGNTLLKRYIQKGILEENEALKRKIEHLERLKTGEEVKAQVLAHGIKQEVVSHAELESQLQSKRPDLESQPFSHNKRRSVGYQEEEPYE